MILALFFACATPSGLDSGTDTGLTPKDFPLEGPWSIGPSLEKVAPQSGLARPCGVECASVLVFDSGQLSHEYSIAGTTVERTSFGPYSCTVHRNSIDCQTSIGDMEIHPWTDFGGWSDSSARLYIDGEYALMQTYADFR